MIWSRWTKGPDESAQSSNVFVSVTRFTASRKLLLPGIALRGLALKRRWHELPGAIGMWLWVDIGERSSGSVSVWRSENDMRNFVRWKPHVETVKRYRSSGVMTSTTWIAPKFRRAVIQRQAALWLAGK